MLSLLLGRAGKCRFVLQFVHSFYIGSQAREFLDRHVITHIKQGLDHHEIEPTFITIAAVHTQHTMNKKILNTINIRIASNICDTLANEKCFHELLKYEYYYNATKQSEYSVKSSIVDGISCNISYFWGISLLRLSVHSTDITKRRECGLCIAHSNILIFRMRLSDFKEYCLQDSETNWYSYFLVFTKFDALYKTIECAKQI